MQRNVKARRKIGHTKANSARAMISPNTIVGNRYKVIKLLGGGGMKLVYLAEDLRLASRRCALAEMVDTFTDPQAQQAALISFQREADMLAQLDHEHIPHIYDRFSEQNHHFLVMEYIEGVTLEEALKAAGGRLEQKQVIDIALQILDTLEYLHGLNPPVIYRDLKPSNVMLTPTGKVKLVDFGIARFFQPRGNATLIGTQGYAPPEQYRGQVECCSDLYALGATMHHLLSGRDPASEAPFSFPPLAQLCPNVDPVLAALVDHALAYDARRRIQSASEFKARLIAIRDSLASTSSAPHTQGPAPAQASQGDVANAPTMRLSDKEIACPSCGALIPSDSHFCSYCASDLRLVLGADHLAQTTSAHDSARAAGALNRPQSQAQVHRVARRRRRHPIATFLLTVILGVLVLRVIPYIFMGFAAILAFLAGHDDTPAPGAHPPAEESLEVSPADTVRAFALRRILDAQGYRSVKVKVQGQNVELWGTVPSETDRLAIEATAFAVTGAITLNDHIVVKDPGTVE